MDFGEDWERASAERPLDNPENNCEECFSNSFEFADGKWYCLDCGTQYKSKKLDEKEWNDSDFDIEPDDDFDDEEDMVEDREWKDSQFFVPQKQKSGRTGKNTQLIPPMISTLMKARSLLHMNKRTKSIDRTPYFSPFYDSSVGRALPVDAILSSSQILPAPFVNLLYNDQLPPRKWWHKSKLGTDGKPSGSSDWIPHYHRLGFELYIHLHSERNRPWSLVRWSEKIRIGSRLFEILQKGGALGYTGSRYLQQLNHQGMIKPDVYGFIENLSSMNIATFENPNSVCDQAWIILENMLHKKSRESTVLTRFKENNCMISLNNNPSQFWCMHNKSRKEVGQFFNVSIPIAFAVAEAASQLEGLQPISILEIAYSDVQVINTNDIGKLNRWWRWCMKQIDQTSTLS